MASPRLGPCSERAWSPPQTNGGTGASPPAQAAWPGPAACCRPVQEVLVGGGGEVGLLYLELGDKIEKPPLFLQGTAGQLSVAWLGHHRSQAQGQLRDHSGPKPGRAPQFPLRFPWGAGFLGPEQLPCSFHRALSWARGPRHELATSLPSSKLAPAWGQGLDPQMWPTAMARAFWVGAALPRLRSCPPSQEQEGGRVLDVQPAGTPCPGVVPGSLGTRPSTRGWRHHPPGNLSLTRGAWGPPGCLGRPVLLPFSPRPGLRPPPGPPTQQRHPEDHDLESSELGARGPSPAGLTGRGEGQGELKPSRCVGIRAAFLARAEPPRPAAASEDIYRPLPSGGGGPWQPPLESGGPYGRLKRPLGLGSFPSAVTTPQLPPDFPLCPHGAGCSLPPRPCSPTAREGCLPLCTIPAGPRGDPSPHRGVRHGSEASGPQDPGRSPLRQQRWRSPWPHSVCGLRKDTRPQQEQGFITVSPGEARTAPPPQSREPGKVRCRRGFRPRARSTSLAGRRGCHWATGRRAWASMSAQCCRG